jgi:hypothetical protein
MAAKYRKPHTAPMLCTRRHASFPQRGGPSSPLEAVAYVLLVLGYAPSCTWDARTAAACGKGLAAVQPGARRAGWLSRGMTPASSDQQAIQRQRGSEAGSDGARGLALPLDAFVVIL